MTLRIVDIHSEGDGRNDPITLTVTLENSGDFSPEEMAMLWALRNQEVKVVAMSIAVKAVRT